LKKLLLLILALIPMVLFASSEDVQTDIFQRTINFVIFCGILWYLLAHKIRAFFANRIACIQAQLDKVEDTLKASQDKVDEATKKLEEARGLATEIVESAKIRTKSVKQKVTEAVDVEIINLNKNFDEKVKIEIAKTKRQVISEILEELLSSNNISLTQDELVDIVFKKAA